MAVTEAKRRLDTGRAPTWRNHYLTTRGIVPGPYSWPTEETARGDAAAFFVAWVEYQAEGGSLPVDLPDGSTMPFECFRCAFQVPVFG